MPRFIADENVGKLGRMLRMLGLRLQELVRPFTRCIECNQALLERTKEEVAQRVPPYVFATQGQYRECPACGRIFWRGTHWQAMSRLLEALARC